MFKKFSVLAAILLIASIPLAAHGGRLSYKGLSFEYGSITANATLTGIGGDDVIVTLSASGIPVVTCSNKGANEAPGRNPSRVGASGGDLIGEFDISRNGTAPFSATAEEPLTFALAVDGGCPNNNWTAYIDFVLWDTANISVRDLAGNVLRSQDYTCVTTRVMPPTDPETGTITCIEVR